MDSRRENMKATAANFYKQQQQVDKCELMYCRKEKKSTELFSIIIHTKKKDVMIKICAITTR